MTVQNTFLDEVFIIIVLYKQTLLESKSFVSLFGQLNLTHRPTLFVYDNSKLACPVPSGPQFDIIYQHHPDNRGVSAAYNEGFRIAKQRGKKWLLLADQDTEFQESILFEYGNATEKNICQVLAPMMQDNTGIISPFRLVAGKGVRIKMPPSGIFSLDKYTPINSGLLVSMVAYQKCGGYDERFPLDFSDIAFTERLAKFFSGFFVVNVVCRHHFSGSTDGLTLSERVSRFVIFCRAVTLYKKISARRVVPSWVILPRAIKLSFLFKTFKFLKIGFHFIR